MRRLVLLLLAFSLLCTSSWARLPADCRPVSDCCAEMEALHGGDGPAAATWAKGPDEVRDALSYEPAQGVVAALTDAAPPDDADVPCHSGAAPCADGSCHCEGPVMNALLSVQMEVPVTGPRALGASPYLQPAAQHVPEGLQRPPHTAAF